jgi:hypothetical protein
MSNYQEKYLKYKNKYIELQNQIGGFITVEQKESLQKSFMDLTHNRQQIKYCISQMKRFAVCMSLNNNTMRKYQFFYQLGRIQELLASDPSIWWNPFETMIKASDYAGIIAYTDTLCEAIGCGYDTDIIAKEC